MNGGFGLLGDQNCEQTPRSDVVRDGLVTEVCSMSRISEFLYFQF